MNILTVSIYSFIKIIILLLFIALEKVKSDNDKILYFKSMYLFENIYYIVTHEAIYYYCNTENKKNINPLFTFGDNQRITTEEETEMISLGRFKNYIINSTLLTIKNYVYALNEGEYYCNEVLDKIEGYSLQVFPFNCVSFKCYYIVGIINSSKQLFLYLYSNIPPLYNSSLSYSFPINDIGSNTFSCQIMESLSYDEVLTCFYQNNTKKEITY